MRHEKKLLLKSIVHLKENGSSFGIMFLYEYIFWFIRKVQFVWCDHCNNGAINLCVSFLFSLPFLFVSKSFIIGIDVAVAKHVKRIQRYQVSKPVHQEIRGYRISIPDRIQPMHMERLSFKVVHIQPKPR